MITFLLRRSTENLLIQTACYLSAIGFNEGIFAIRYAMKTLSEMIRTFEPSFDVVLPLNIHDAGIKHYTGIS